MILRVHPDNPEKHKIKSIVASIKNGSIIIIPTDSVYAIACDLYNKKAVERICIIKGIKPRDANFSLLCADLSNLSDFTLNLSKTVFKVLKRNLPGPFTFILNANNNVPTPTVPPKYQPIETTVISKNALTNAIGKLVFSWSPVINPSLGPGPRLAIK